MAQLGVFWLFLVAAVCVLALEVSYVTHFEFPHKFEYEKTAIGGLSGLSFNPTTGILTAISDDRGNVNEPRLYKFKLKLTGQKLEIVPIAVKFIKKKTKSIYFDGEAIVQLENGNYILSSEGDNNRKPRIMPELVEITEQGRVLKQISIPRLFMPETAGRQTKGIVNNEGIEGMDIHPSQKLIVTALETPLLQDRREDENFSRLLFYEKNPLGKWLPGKQVPYALDTKRSDNITIFRNGISEILFITEQRLLILERGLNITNLGFDSRLYEVDIADSTDVSKISSLKETSINIKSPLKNFVFDFESLSSKIGRQENYEGMAWVSFPENPKKYLIVCSDDNFRAVSKTLFVLFEIKKDVTL